MKFTRESLQLISSSIIHENPTNQYRLCIQERANFILLLENITPALRSLALSQMSKGFLKEFNADEGVKGITSDPESPDNDLLFSLIHHLLSDKRSNNVSFEKPDAFATEVSCGELDLGTLFSTLHAEILELHKAYHLGKYVHCKMRIRAYMQLVLTCQALRECFLLFVQFILQFLFIWISCNEAIGKRGKLNFRSAPKKKDLILLLISGYLFAELISSVNQVNDAEKLLFTDDYSAPLLEVMFSFS